MHFGRNFLPRTCNTPLHVSSPFRAGDGRLAAILAGILSVVTPATFALCGDTASPISPVGAAVGITGGSLPGHLRIILDVGPSPSPREQ